MSLNDPETDVAPGETRGGNVRSRGRRSMCPAIHIYFRSWLRSSSTREPSDPPSRVVFLLSLHNKKQKKRKQMATTAKGGRRPSAPHHPSLKPTIVRVTLPNRWPSRRRARGDNSVSYNPAQASLPPPAVYKMCAVLGNDPSAGSPTETLLRLLLPLDDAVRFSFRSASRDKPRKQPVRGPH